MESAVLDLAFAPHLPWVWLAGLGVVAALAAGAGFWHRWRGSFGRLVAAGALLAALANPQLEIEQRESLADVVFLGIDASPSQALGARPEQTREAEASLLRALDALASEGGFSYRMVPVDDAGTAGETRLLSALGAAAREIDASRIAGAVLVTDGKIHDAEALTQFPGPVHALITGEAGERDRRVRLLQAPAFGILRDGVDVSVRVEDAGVAGENGPVELELRVDDRTVSRTSVVPGTAQRVHVPLIHPGRSVVELRVPGVEGEITGRNNSSVFAVSGIRDRLRVLLVSGSPHPAARVWRSLLKSDPAVDLVHFVLLRPVNKHRVAVDTELSLIQFPAQRLFVEDIDGFDLIIFDRFRRQGILSDTYFANFTRYVREGGAVLLAGSSSFASSNSIARSPMREVLPADPTGRVLAREFEPSLSSSGARHPLTSALAEGLARAGPWYQQAELSVQRGQVLLDGAAGPLLVVDRVGEGRVGVLGSEHAWLWSRGHGGGGPHGELIRRTAHWLMKEPELEEESLRLEIADDTMTVIRRTLADVPDAPVVSGPDGVVREVPLAARRPGLWQGTLRVPEPGVYRAESGDLSALALAGSGDSLEYRDPISTAELLEPLAVESGGSVRRLTEGVPQVRRVLGESTASGEDWIGFPRRGAYAVLGLRNHPLLPAWLALLLVIGGLGLAWWMESGRRLFRTANSAQTSNASNSAAEAFPPGQ